MILRSWLVQLVCLAALTLAGATIAEEPTPEEQHVYNLLSGYEPNGGVELPKLGEKAFVAYEKLLADPKENPDMIARAFLLIGDVEADRSRFVKYAVSHLTNPKFGVRLNAVKLLEDIGSVAEASAVVALLSDERLEIACSAAWTLAAIGGPNELVALDVWLRGVSHRDNAGIRQCVQKCRDKLKKRLDEARDPRKRAQLRQQSWRGLRNKEMGAQEVQHAVWTLTAFGAETVAFLKEHIHPVSTETQKHFDQLLADLDGDSFDRREAATRELSRGVVADSVLEKSLANSPSLELRRRLEAILEDLPAWRTKNPELLRQVRAIWVLQQIGTPEAQALLEKLAVGAPSARQTQKAKAALESLKKR